MSDNEHAIVLSPDAWREFNRIIEDPSPPTPALIALAEEYRDEISTGRFVHRSE